MDHLYIDCGQWLMRRCPDHLWERRGDRIRFLEDLDQVAKAGGSVILPVWSKPKPAAFMLSMQARVVLGFIRQGMWVYRKRKDDGR